MGWLSLNNGKAGMLCTCKIVQSELVKLNMSGVWTVAFKQNLMRREPYTYLKQWMANIRLTVTDLKSQQIYFSAFPGAAL